MTSNGASESRAVSIFIALALATGESQTEVDLQSRDSSDLAIHPPSSELDRMSGKTPKPRTENILSVIAAAVYCEFVIVDPVSNCFQGIGVFWVRWEKYVVSYQFLRGNNGFVQVLLVY